MIKKSTKTKAMTIYEVLKSEGVYTILVARTKELITLEAAKYLFRCSISELFEDHEGREPFTAWSDTHVYSLINDRNHYYDCKKTPIAPTKEGPIYLISE